MKTIYTSLPIYDNIAKQCYERIKKSKLDKLVPIITPRHRLPSFQWNAETVDMGDVTRIEMLKEAYDATETTVSTGWGTDTGFDVFAHTGLEITTAENAGGVCAVSTNIGATIRGTQIRIVGTLTLIGGTAPAIWTDGVLNSVSIAEGANDIILTCTSTVANASVTIYYNGATDYTFAGVAITRIDNNFNITDFFPTLPVETNLTSDTYYTHEGDTLKWLLAAGVYYLKITMEEDYILYSEWFQVTCVYENLITEFTNVDYNTFTSSGTTISNAVETIGDGSATSDDISVIKDEVITVILNYVSGSGADPSVVLYSDDEASNVSNIVVLTEGINTVTFTVTKTVSDAVLKIYVAAASQYSTSEIQVQRAYSAKYLNINYSNTCDLGDILYSEGLTQSVWFESETMEPSFPQEDQGVNNGEERFVRSFARQTKKYLARTLDMPDFMAEVFHRMKLHDSIEMIDLVGNENDIYNLEVEHEWLFDDKYLVRVDLTFDYDEAFVIAGCCNNLT